MSNVRIIRLSASGASLAFLIVLILMLFAVNPTAAVSQASAAEECQNFPETGFQVCGKFLAYWNTNGGLAQQGFPISSVFEEKNADPPAGDGKIHKVQYFQRARFEEHLENKAPYDVLLGLLGAEQYHAKYDSGIPAFIGDLTGIPCQAFTETGFKVCGRFLEYWKASGGLTQQGFPISGEFDELNAPPPAGDGKLHRVQYFQRARFEQHSENARPYDVLLGLLGGEQYQAKYGSGKPPVTTPPSTTPPPTTVPPTNNSSSCTVSQPAVSASLAINASLAIANASGGSQTLCVAANKNGQPVAGAKVSFVVRYKSSPKTFTGNDTDATGKSVTSWDIGGPTKGFEIKVDVTVTSGGETVKTTVSWTPQ